MVVAHAPGEKGRFAPCEALGLQPTSVQSGLLEALPFPGRMGGIEEPLTVVLEAVLFCVRVVELRFAGDTPDMEEASLPGQVTLLPLLPHFLCVCVIVCV